MDYGFAPGGTGQDGRARALFARRANTTLVHRRRLTTVRGFVDHLENSAQVARPIDDALLGAHANSEGVIFIPMFPRQRGPTEFETLEDTLADPARSISIPDGVIGHNPGDPITHDVHFKGCNIGKAPPFLVKFKEALGDHVNVTAPKHFHGLYRHNAYGVWEYMAYEFIIRRPANFPNRAAAVAAFEGAGFTFVDGTAVPNANWAGWIPRRIRRTVKTPITGNLGVAIGRRRTIRVERQFRVERFPFTWTITYPTAADVPAPPDRQAEFEQSLQNDPRARFDAAHPFPSFERLGYASFADFIAGYTWSHRRNGRRLVTRGTRTEYTVVIPVTDAAGDLVFNFHPNAGSPHAAIVNLLETDPLYFETV